MKRRKVTACAMAAAHGNGACWNSDAGLRKK